MKFAGNLFLADNDFCKHHKVIQGLIDLHYILTLFINFLRGA